MLPFPVSACPSVQFVKHWYSGFFHSKFHTEFVSLIKTTLLSQEYNKKRGRHDLAIDSLCRGVSLLRFEKLLIAGKWIQGEKL